MCVQDVDVQCVLQFTLVHAAGCALHRHASRVIHRLELYTVCLGQIPDAADSSLGRPKAFCVDDAALRTDSTRCKRTDKTIASGGRHRDERLQLFEPFAIPATHCCTARTLISTCGRKVPGRFYK